MAINFLERMKINLIWNLYLANLVIQAAVSNGPGPDVQHQVWAAVPARHREEMRHCHRDCQRTGRWTQMLIVVMWCSNVDCMCFQKCEQVNEQKCSTTSEPQCTTVQEQICTPLQVDCFFSKDNNFEEQTFWRILIAGPKVQDSLRAEMQLGEPSKVRDSLRHHHGTAVLHN